jgi:DNA-binding NarL/FixJ family response regulator
MSELASKKILLVDDNVEITDKLTQLLALKKYDVTVAHSGKDALDIIEHSAHFNLVILDVMMPPPNGWELLIKIKSNPKTECWPVIMLTALDDETSEANALYDGASDYITKPFRIKTLLARIDAVIQRPVISSGTAVPLQNDIKPLTEREREVLLCLSEGLSNNQIADKLVITRSTVEAHIKAIFSKLKVENRTQAAVMGIKCNLI